MKKISLLILCFVLSLGITVPYSQAANLQKNVLEGTEADYSKEGEPWDFRMSGSYGNMKIANNLKINSKTYSKVYVHTFKPGMFPFSEVMLGVNTKGYDSIKFKTFGKIYTASDTDMLHVEVGDTKNKFKFEANKENEFSINLNNNEEVSIYLGIGKECELYIYDVYLVKNGATQSQSKTPDKVKVIFNGELLSFDQDPIIQSGRTLVPLRTIFEALGLKVEWDQINQTVTGTKDDLSISLKIGDTNAIVNGNKVKLDVPGKVLNGRTLVPVRFIAESTGAEVYWNDMKKEVNITK